MEPATSELKDEDIADYFEVNMARLQPLLSVEEETSKKLL